MDIRMPDGDGLWATGEIVADARLSGTRVVIVTTFELDEYVAQAIVAGASGFLVKDTEPVDLLRGVRAVAAGDALLSPGVTRTLIAQFTARAAAPKPPRELDTLTDREREVLSLMAEGRSNQAISRTMNLSAKSIEGHVRNIFTKLNLMTTPDDHRRVLAVLTYLHT
jgi:DNA-binding NarL/FixJ family response regulator